MAAAIERQYGAEGNCQLFQGEIALGGEFMTTVLAPRRFHVGPWRVEADQPLFDFLRDRVGWIAQVLIDEGLMLVEHANGMIENPTAGSFALINGDTVTQELRVPASFTNKLQDHANDNARDFMFAPGASDFEVKMADFLLAANPRLTKIKAKDLMTFLVELKKHNDQQIGTLHIVGHGWSQGNINVDQSPQRTGQSIEYEGLQDAVADRSLVVDPSLFQPPRPVDPDTKEPIPGTVRIWACRVGIHEPFLDKLREALGRAIGVVAAPLFLQDAGKLGSGGRIEFLRHDFRVLSPRKLDRPSLIRQFQIGDLAYAPGPPRFFDRKPVPAWIWNKWLPQQIHANEDQHVPTLKMETFVAELRKKVRGRGKAPLSVIYHWYKYPCTLENWNLESVKPKDEKDALDKLTAFVAMIGETDEWGARDKHPYRWNDKHPFPISVRYGYKNFADFKNGWKWEVTRASGFTYTFQGTRWEYAVYVPLMHGADLVCNVVSADTPPQTLRQYRDDDSRFFTIIGSN